MPRRRNSGEVRDSATSIVYLPLAYLDSPEFTGTASSVPLPTSTSSQVSQPIITSSTSSFSTSTSTLTPTPTSTSALQHSSNIGAIAGGTVCGIISAALMSGILARFIIRRRRARLAMSTSGQGGEGELEQPVPHPVTIETPRLYVRVLSLILLRKLI